MAIVGKHRHLTSNHPITRKAIMKKNSAKYMCLLALVLAVSASAANAQQRQGTQMHSRQQLHDQSTAGAVQQQTQTRNRNRLRYETGQQNGQQPQQNTRNNGDYGRSKQQ